MDDVQGLSRAAVALLRFQQALNGSTEIAEPTEVKTRGHLLPSSGSSRRAAKRRGRKSAQKKSQRKDWALKNDTQLSTFNLCVQQSGAQQLKILPSPSESEDTSHTPPRSKQHLSLDRSLLECVMPRLLKASEEEIQEDLQHLGCPVTEYSAARALFDLSLHLKRYDIASDLPSNRLLDPLPEPSLPKPQPRCSPRVWADTRQELCESLPYFRAYQSGVYVHNNLAMGYLLDAFVSSRDHIGSRVVISHAGGKACSTSMANGGHDLREDQLLGDRSVSGLINNYNTRQPLVLIIGNKCSIAPTAMPHRYCVMDWFRVSHVWTERDSGLNSPIRYKFRFEKLTYEPGWWSASDASTDQTSSPGASCPPICEQTCQSCLQASPIIYQQFICLNVKCELFWQTDSQEIGIPLTLSDAFKSSFAASDIRAPFDLRPDVALHSKEFYSGNDVARIFWRGICCPSCGKLNSRILWHGWTCSSCNFTKMEIRKVYDIAEVLDPFRPFYDGPPLCFDWKNPLCKFSTETTEDGSVRHTRYNLGPDIGIVHHISCSDRLRTVTDEIFRDYQTQNIDFRRHALKTKVDGQFLSAQFSHNAGARYKYHADAGTEEFDVCAPVILRARDLIIERVNRACGSHTFNEILSVAYFEGQHMGYHDDGETGVSSVVASLSLGSAATMKFRPKRGKEAHFFDDAVSRRPPSAVNEGNIDTPTQVDPVASMPTIRQPNGRDILRLRLDHGDIMIMQGDNFQKIIEHSVTPSGFRIAATARHITVKGEKVLEQG